MSKELSHEQKIEFLIFAWLLVQEYSTITMDDIKKVYSAKIDSYFELENYIITKYFPSYWTDLKPDLSNFSDWIEKELNSL